MSDSKDFLNDFVFEQYLYDYLVKKGLPEIAETFRQEINLPFDISTPPLIDVPDSFLLEWWLTYYEMFKAYEARSLQVKENSSNKVQGITNVNQESAPYLQNAQIFSEPMRREVTGGVTTGGSLVPMMGSPSVASQPSQNLSAILERFYQPVNLSNVFIQGVGPSSLATPNIRKDALNKNRRKRKNSSSSNDGSTPGATASSVETSASVFQPSKESDSKEEDDTWRSKPGIWKLILRLACEQNKRFRGKLKCNSQDSQKKPSLCPVNGDWTARIKQIQDTKEGSAH